MAYDGEAVVKGGRLVLEGLPFEDGRAVRFEVTPVDERPSVPSLSEQTAEEWIEAFHGALAGIHARHPDMPVLSDEAMSRESIYADDGL